MGRPGTSLIAPRDSIVAGGLPRPASLAPEGASGVFSEPALCPHPGGTFTQACHLRTKRETELHLARNPTTAALGGLTFHLIPLAQPWRRVQPYVFRFHPCPISTSVQGIRPLSERCPKSLRKPPGPKCIRRMKRITRPVHLKPWFAQARILTRTRRTSPREQKLQVQLFLKSRKFRRTNMHPRAYHVHLVNSVRPVCLAQTTPRVTLLVPPLMFVVPTPSTRYVDHVNHASYVSHINRTSPPQQLKTPTTARKKEQSRQARGMLRAPRRF